MPCDSSESFPNLVPVPEPHIRSYTRLALGTRNLLLVARARHCTPTARRSAAEFKMRHTGANPRRSAEIGAEDSAPALISGMRRRSVRESLHARRCLGSAGADRKPQAARTEQPRIRGRSCARGMRVRCHSRRGSKRVNRKKGYGDEPRTVRDSAQAQGGLMRGVGCASSVSQSVSRWSRRVGAPRRLNRPSLSPRVVRFDELGLLVVLRLDAEQAPQEEERDVELCGG
ncbi:hypothetical protein B0H17DRAFT_189136 [Mycena rosella]|uniref:Uncharacterized protein n=1 Tax=Mycena rosella TaxID=1033263 RepID=A0AAD7GME9_MYCRO|nr:hypothetical protein B0H17DRAFT_189136 [Mycena rosella]